MFDRKLSRMMVLVIAISSLFCLAANSFALSALADIPALPKPEALRGISESLVISEPAVDPKGDAEQAMTAATRDVRPGTAAGGPLPKLEMRPAVPTPNSRRELPKITPPAAPEKPVLTVRPYGGR